MLHPLTFWFGYVTFSVDERDAPFAVNILGGSGKNYRNFVFDGGRAFFECSLISERAAARTLSERGIEYKIEKRSGLPALIWRYRKRYGIAVGALIFLFMILFSNVLIWDVRVEGNVNLSEEEVEAELSECGFGVGTLVSTVNTPVLENILLLNSDKISWVSINISGCVAVVEIREATYAPEDVEATRADLLAERDGVIAWFEDTRGNTLVNIGDSVKAGQVLISGYYPEDENVGERFTVARGRVYAMTERYFETSIPLIYDKKVYTGRKKTEKYIILFGKEVKIFGNSRNLYEKCDTINTVDHAELWRGVLLPFGVRTVEHLEYREICAERSETEAIELALYRLRYIMEDGVRDGTLIKKRISGSLTDEEYKVSCHASYIEDIAVKKIYQ